jgi:hypothetical protein
VDIVAVEDVRWLHISVNEARSMRRVQRLAKLHDEVRGTCGLEARLASEQLCKRRFIHKLHGEEEFTTSLIDPIHRKDVRMPE